jgi:hypothetical protein
MGYEPIGVLTGREVEQPYPRMTHWHQFAPKVTCDPWNKIANNLEKDGGILDNNRYI